jgi:hypothetical protein
MKNRRSLRSLLASAALLTAGILALSRLAAQNPELQQRLAAVKESAARKYSQFAGRNQSRFHHADQRREQGTHGYFKELELSKTVGKLCSQRGIFFPKKSSCILAEVVRLSDGWTLSPDREWKESLCRSFS